MIFIKRFLFCFGILGLLASCMETTGTPTSQSPSEIRLNMGGLYRPGNNCTRKTSNGYDNPTYSACLASAFAIRADDPTNHARYKYFVFTVANANSTEVAYQGDVKFDNFRRTSNPNVFYARARIEGRAYSRWSAAQITAEKSLSVDVVISTTSNGLVNRIEFPNTSEINTIMGTNVGNRGQSIGRILYRIPASQYSAVATAQRAANANTQGLILDEQIRQNEQNAQEARIAAQNLAIITGALTGNTGQSGSSELASGTASNSTTPPPISAVRCVRLSTKSNSLGSFHTITNGCRNVEIFITYCGVGDPSRVNPCPSPQQLRANFYSGGGNPNWTRIPAGETRTTSIETRYSLNYYAHQCDPARNGYCNP